MWSLAKHSFSVRKYEQVSGRDDDEISPAEDCDRVRARSPIRRGLPRWLAPTYRRFLPPAFVLTCVATLVGLLLYTAGTQHLPPGTGSPSASDDSSLTLARALHPQDHVGRSPRTISHEWTITSDARRPDGVEKVVYLINGLFPGPTVEAASGDTLKITVFNGLNDQGVAIHWHGLHMQGANNMDGAVGITQAPIEPGGTFTYVFNISDHQHGTFWYHAHDRVQRGDGLYGGFVVHDPKSELDAQSVDQLLLIGDWYHQSSQDTLARYMTPGSFGNEPVPDSIVINDKGAYNCPDASPARPVDCIATTPEALPALLTSASQRHRFRVVNTGTLAGFSLAMPGVNMTSIEVDGGQELHPATSDKIGVVYPGQRIDFFVDFGMSMLTADSYLEIELDDDNFRDPNPALTSVQRFPVLHRTDRQAFAGEPLEAAVPFDILTAKSRKMQSSVFPQAVDETIVIYATTLKLSHRANVPHGYVNQTSWTPQEQPLLSTPRSQWDQNQLVPYIPLTETGLWIDLVINNIDDGGHPFHLHGYSFFVLQTSQGTSFWGSYNPFEDDTPPGGPPNTDNPVMRDTVFVPARGYVILRFHASNPGLWFAHCHLLTHQASGMAMAFQVGGNRETGFA